MSFTMRPAVRQNVPLLIGLTSDTGGGKTYSALRLAAGIAGPGKRFGAIDTERRRMSHYADDFGFDVLDLEPPYSPKRFLAAIQHVVKAGCPCAVIDSVSHEWAGEGGVLAMHDAAVDRMAGANADWKKREAMNWPAWREPKGEHRDFMEGLLQVPIPLVLCFRGKVGQKPGVDPETKKKVLVETPFKATTSDDLPWELTVLLVLSNLRPGTIDLGQPNKIGKPIRPMIRDGELLNEEFGARLAAWARGGEAPKRRTISDAVAELRQRVREAPDAEALDRILAEDDTGKLLGLLSERDPELAKTVNLEVRERMDAVTGEVA